MRRRERASQASVVMMLFVRYGVPEPTSEEGTPMDHIEVGAYWDGNAEAWTKLSRAGYDVYRDHLNTPAFFEMLPDVHGHDGLDIGCGEGHNTRLLAQRGARVAA